MHAPLPAGPSLAAPLELLSGREPLAHMQDDAVGKRFPLGFDIAEALIERDDVGGIIVHVVGVLQDPQRRLGAVASTVASSCGLLPLIVISGAQRLGFCAEEP